MHADPGDTARRSGPPPAPRHVSACPPWIARFHSQLGDGAPKGKGGLDAFAYILIFQAALSATCVSPFGAVR